MKTILWIHEDCLNPQSAALQAHPGAAAVFVFPRAVTISLKRIVFIYECLLELPVEIRRGEVEPEIAAFAREHGATRIVTMASPNPEIAAAVRALQQLFDVEVIEPPPFTDYRGAVSLRRFSQFWRKVEPYAMR